MSGGKSVPEQGDNPTPSACPPGAAGPSLEHGHCSAQVSRGRPRAPGLPNLQAHCWYLSMKGQCSCLFKSGNRCAEMPTLMCSKDNKKWLVSQSLGMHMNVSSRVPQLPEDRTSFRRPEAPCRLPTPLPRFTSKSAALCWESCHFPASVNRALFSGRSGGWPRLAGGS